MVSNDDDFDEAEADIIEQEEEEDDDDEAALQIFVCNGKPIKFRIQRDLYKDEPEERTRLEHKIELHGGTVLDVLPLSGYIVVDFSDQGAVAYYARQENDRRRCVSVNFIARCIRAGKIEAPIFVDETNQPVKVWLHPSLNEEDKGQVHKRLLDRGAKVVDDLADAAVIILNKVDDPESFALLEMRCQHTGSHLVESSWVAVCISERRYRHDPIVRRKMSGRPPGTAPVPFDAADCAALVDYLYKRVPIKAEGGRTSRKLWEDFVDPLLCDLYPRANRHPWESWQNQYKKNQEMYDRLIDKRITQDGIPPLKLRFIPKRELNHYAKHWTQPRPVSLDRVDEEDDEREEPEQPRKRVRREGIIDADAPKVQVSNSDGNASVRPLHEDGDLFLPALDDIFRTSQRTLVGSQPAAASKGKGMAAANQNAELRQPGTQHHSGFSQQPSSQRLPTVEVTPRRQEHDVHPSWGKDAGTGWDEGGFGDNQMEQPELLRVPSAQPEPRTSQGRRASPQPHPPQIQPVGSQHIALPSSSAPPYRTVTFAPPHSNAQARVAKVVPLSNPAPWRVNMPPPPPPSPRKKAPQHPVSITQSSPKSADDRRAFAPFRNAGRNPDASTYVSDVMGVGGAAWTLVSDVDDLWNDDLNYSSHPRSGDRSRSSSQNRSASLGAHSSVSHNSHQIRLAADIAEMMEDERRHAEEDAKASRWAGQQAAGSHHSSTMDRTPHRIPAYEFVNLSGSQRSNSGPGRAMGSGLRGSSFAPSVSGMSISKAGRASAGAQQASSHLPSGSRTRSNAMARQRAANSNPQPVPLTEAAETEEDIKMGPLLRQVSDDHNDKHSRSNSRGVSAPREDRDGIESGLGRGTIMDDASIQASSTPRVNQILPFVDLRQLTGKRTAKRKRESGPMFVIRPPAAKSASSVSSVLRALAASASSTPGPSSALMLGEFGDGGEGAASEERSNGRSKISSPTWRQGETRGSSGTNTSSSKERSSDRGQSDERAGATTTRIYGTRASTRASTRGDSVGPLASVKRTLRPRG